VFSRESGVRNLERKIERLMHQLAYKYVSTKDQRAIIEASDSAPPLDPHRNIDVLTAEAEQIQKGKSSSGSADVNTNEATKEPELDWRNMQIQPSDLFGYLGKPKYSQVDDVLIRFRCY
jgi:ATP-dependent Lon protease